MALSIRMPHLHPWQEDVFEDIKGSKYDIYCVKAKRQVGKSILAVTALLYYAFKDKSISVCVEPTLKQSRRVYKQILSAIGGDNSPAIKSANQTLLSIEFVNGSEIILMSAEQEDALRGATVKKGILIIDESAYIKDDIFSILYPLVDANNCPVILISTPLFMSGEFYTKYKDGSVENNIIKSYNWSTYDTSVFLSKEKLEYYRKTVTPLKFQTEYLGEFISEGSYCFGDIMKVVGELSDKPSTYAGIDWAAGGEDNDYTVLTLMDDDGAVTGIHSFRNMSPTDQVEKLSGIINSNPSLKCVQVEMNSIGEVYHDMLKRRVKTRLKCFQTTNDSKRRIVEQLITAFENGKVRVPSEPELLHELQHYGMEKTSKGYTYNGQEGVHDDFVMSLAFAYDAHKSGGRGGSIAFV